MIVIHKNKKTLDKKRLKDNSNDLRFSFSLMYLWLIKLIMLSQKGEWTDRIVKIRIQLFSWYLLEEVWTPPHITNNSIIISSKDDQRKCIRGNFSGVQDYWSLSGGYYSLSLERGKEIWKSNKSFDISTSPNLKNTNDVIKDDAFSARLLVECNCNDKDSHLTQGAKYNYIIFIEILSKLASGEDILNS